MENKTLGQIAYEAYCATTDWKSAISGAPLPQYNVQNPKVIEAWEAAGNAVVDSVVNNAATDKAEGLYQGAFSNALALESVPEDAFYHEPSGMTIMDSTTLVRFAAVVAYKTATNLNNGLTMDQHNNPLTAGETE